MVPVMASMEADEEEDSINNQIELIPIWRRWIVQWDISHFAIPLAFFAFTAMWQATASHLGHMNHVSESIYLTMFYTSCIILIMSLSIFLIRIIIYPKAITFDFNHPRLMNFFYMPIIVGSLLVLTLPQELRSITLFKVAFYILAGGQLCLSLYMFGEWLFGAHPTNFIHPLVFMQTIGYFLTSNIAARCFLIEQSTAMAYIGTLFWLLVFLTNFQHVSLALDKQREKPSPPFFLFIAPPAQAAITFVVLRTAEYQQQQPNSEDIVKSLLSLEDIMQWPELGEAFLYIDLFIYFLILRLFPTIWTSKFTVSSWAYIFPLSAASSMMIFKFDSTDLLFWKILSLSSGVIACIAMLIVLVFTIRSIANGQTPSNPPCLLTYAHYYAEKNTPNSQQGEDDEDQQSESDNV